MRRLLCLFTFLALACPAASWADTSAPQPQKEWTFLVFINGFNNLDSYGAGDINEMEKIGTTDNINVVVQWASTSASTVKRLLVIKDTDTANVTSPILADLGQIDMGSWQNLVDFAKWGITNFPAKKYAVVVWNHGGGWHKGFNLHPLDISYDENSGNSINIPQLGQAMAEIARIAGHKIDLYGNDACLMGMAEVAAELAPSVNTFVGSEETEPGDGWPYDDILQRWSASPQMSSNDLGKVIVDLYVKSYQNGSQGKSEATQAAYDLNKAAAFNAEVKKLGDKITGLDKTSRKKVMAAAKKTLGFAYADYKDLSDLMTQIKAAGIPALRAEDFAPLGAALQDYVLMNSTTPKYAKAKGVAIWMPTSSYSYGNYSDIYSNLSFDTQTNWGNVLKTLMQDMRDDDGK